jgi:hypothetical protein
MTINAGGSWDDLAPASGGQRFCAINNCDRPAVVNRVLDASNTKTGDPVIDAAMERPVLLCVDHERVYPGRDVPPSE